MIRTLLSLLPQGSGRTVAGHLVLTVIGLVLRAAGCGAARAARRGPVR